jgi:hypothetical protein
MTYVYSIRLEVGSVQESLGSSEHSSFVMRHSGKEDARGLVNNGTSLRGSLIVICHN